MNIIQENDYPHQRIQRNIEDSEFYHKKEKISEYQKLLLSWPSVIMLFLGKCFLPGLPYNLVLVFWR